MKALWLSLALVFLAEMGDNTQLVALGLATRYKPSTVLAGITLATAIIHLFSVWVGGLIGDFIPMMWIKVVAGLSFLGFAAWTLRGDEDDGSAHKEPPFGPLLTTTIIFFLAELGDKTQLMTISLATHGPFIPTWIGSTVGMVLADGLAIAAGLVLGKSIPEHKIKMVAVGAFILFGILTLVDAFVPLF